METHKMGAKRAFWGYRLQDEIITVCLLFGQTDWKLA
jgi:hypothetical protein